MHTSQTPIYVQKHQCRKHYIFLKELHISGSSIQQVSDSTSSGQLHPSTDKQGFLHCDIITDHTPPHTSYYTEAQLWNWNDQTLEGLRLVVPFPVHHNRSWDFLCYLSAQKTTSGFLQCMTHSRSRSRYVCSQWTHVHTQLNKKIYPSRRVTSNSAGSFNERQKDFPCFCLSPHVACLYKQPVTHYHLHSPVLCRTRIYRLPMWKVCGKK